MLFCVKRLEEIYLIDLFIPFQVFYYHFEALAHYLNILQWASLALIMHTAIFVFIFILQGDIKACSIKIKNKAGKDDNMENPRK